MPGVPNLHLPGRGLTDLTSRGRYEDDVATARRGIRESRSIEQRLAALESAISSAGFLWINVEVSNDYTIPGGFYHARVNTVGGNIIVTLPPLGALNGQMVSIIKVDAGANTVTIVPDGLDGMVVPTGADVLANSGESLTLIATDYESIRAWDYV